MLRALRDQPGLVALLGDWHHGDALIAVRPVHVLGADEDPFEAVDTSGRTDPGAPGSFGGGWIGYLGYQLGGRLEQLPEAPPCSGGLPDHHLAHYDHALRCRADTGEWVLESLPGADPARVRETAMIVADALADADRQDTGGARPYRCGPFTADASRDEHAAAVARTLGHIRDGDVFQANICRSLGAGFEGDPLDLFCAGVEALAPRFAAFLRVPGGAVASLSPELFLRRTGESVL
ncbi:chorismate-binding protein, partial [Kocuria dechangensis]|uniref:chorismate-binding protein n=1 Tax=Kocuria dechangensis TaxID=1176249 RepID=UPI001E596EDD